MVPSGWCGPRRGEDRPASAGEVSSQSILPRHSRSIVRGGRRISIGSVPCPQVCRWTGRRWEAINKANDSIRRAATGDEGLEGDYILAVYLPIFVGEVSDEVLENLCQARCQNSQLSYF